MKNTLALILISFLFSHAVQTGTVSDTITSDTTFSDTVEVFDGMVITNNAQVSVEPGTVFLFHGKSLWIDSGSITVNGEEGDSVYFGPAGGETWNGIGIVDSTNSSAFSYAVIEGVSSFNALFLSDSVECSLRHSSIRNNSKGIFAANSRITIDSTTITKSSDGEGIWAAQSRLDLKSVMVTENKRGIHVSNCTLTVDNHSSISSNLSESGGAGISSYYSYTTISNSEIIGNTTYDSWGGGGVYATGDTGWLKMKNVLVSYNRAGKAGENSKGGGVSVFAVDAELEEVCFYGNSASNEGGALVFNSTAENGSMRVNRSYFINNSVTNNSGTLGADFSAVSSQDVRISNSLFKASTGAHAVNLWGILQQDEFYLVNNTMVDCEGLVRVASGTSVSLINSMAHNTSGELFAVHDSGVLTQEGNLTDVADPLLTELQGAPYYQIEKESPCIDKGTSFSEIGIGELDLAGNPRKSGSAVDIGAYEYQHDAALSSAGTVSHEKSLLLLSGNRIAVAESNGGRMITVASLNGRIVYQEALKSGEVELVLPSSIASGIYLISLKSSAGVETLPVMIK